MSTTRQRLQRSAIQIDSAASELNSLASNGVVVSVVVFSNVIGDTQGQGSDLCEAAVNLGSAAFGANAALYIWWLEKKDGTNFETPGVSSGTTTTPPLARPADLVIAVPNVTQANTNLRAYGDLPLCGAIKALFWNQTGVALAASGNSAFIYPQTDTFQ